MSKHMHAHLHTHTRTPDSALANQLFVGFSYKGQVDFYETKITVIS